MANIIIIAHDMRSTHNVGSLLRTAEGMGVEKVYLTGYTPYPLTDGDARLPHIAVKLHKQIQKTALGAETLQSWEHHADITDLITTLKTRGYTIAALEQSPQAINVPDYHAPQKIAIILGREVEGVDDDLLSTADVHLEIPMLGSKESYNVVQAAAIVLYHIKFIQ